MPPRSLQLDTTLAYARGAYTVALELGSRRQCAHFVLDTGSSTLVVLGQAYDAHQDQSLQPTAWAQQVRYGQGTWVGPVLHTEVHLGEGVHARRLPSAALALVQAQAQAFSGYDGLFGLAFSGLNRAHDVTALLAQREVSPALTWPWPFDQDDNRIGAFGDLLRQQPWVTLTPLFTEAEEDGVVADKFALLVRRSLVHVLDDDAAPHALAGDPLNRGVLVLGGGEERQDLYEGPFRDVQVVHELYYNAELIAVQVGSQPRIAAPALCERDAARVRSNAILDSGSTFLILEHSLYEGVLAGFATHDARLPALVERFVQAFATQSGLPNHTIDHRAWPDLHFYLRAPDGGEVKLTCTPGDYWQRNALRAGQTCFLLMDQLAGWAPQTVLGLPLMAGYYCIFDRRGTGVVRFAKAQGE